MSAPLLPPSGGPSPCNVPEESSGLRALEKSNVFTERTDGMDTRSLRPEYLHPQENDICPRLSFSHVKVMQRGACRNRRQAFRIKTICERTPATWCQSGPPCLKLTTTWLTAAAGFCPHRSGPRLLRSAAVPHDSETGPGCKQGAGSGTPNLYLRSQSGAALLRVRPQPERPLVDGRVHTASERCAAPQLRRGTQERAKND